MTATQAIQQIIRDIQNLRNAKGGSTTIRRQELAFEYLSANKQLIVDFIDGAYRMHSNDERKALLPIDNTLDESGIDPGFRNLALGFVTQIEMSPDMGAFSEDSLHMLVRGLRYARHFNYPDHDYHIEHSPIDADTV
jgi:hypothetical protein